MVPFLGPPLIVHGSNYSFCLRSQHVLCGTCLSDILNIGLSLPPLSSKLETVKLPKLLTIVLV